MNTDLPGTAYPFLRGGGEMGTLTRRFNWSKTALGTPDRWPPSLRTTLGILLNAAFPMLLFWGPELIQFYNDAFRPSLGNGNRHPTALGQRGEEVWPEIWPVIKPILQGILGGGEAILIENRLFPIYRNGELENVYWTFSCNPVPGEDGSIAGILVTCTETTQQVTNMRQLQESEARFRSLIEEAPVATCFFTGRELRIEVANGQMLRFWGKDRSVLGQPLAQAVPVLKGQPFLDILDEVFTTGHTYEAKGAPAELEIDGVAQTFYFDFAYKPLRNAEGEVYGIMNMAIEVTEGILAQQKIGEGQRQTQLALENEVQQRTEELAASLEELRATNEELAATNEKLEESNSQLIHSNAELAQYAYVASHDLQEPLRKIRIFAGMLGEQQGLTARGTELVEKISASSERMSLLIKDLLEFSRLLKSDSLMRPVNLGEVLAAVISDFELTIADKEAVIETGELPVIEAVALQMNQLFFNLLSNALKFTSPQTIPHLRITAKPIGAGEAAKYIHKPFPFANYYMLIFTDNGIGFNTQYAEQIFEVFKRLHGRDQYPGSGIGLALCRRIAANHHGALYAESVPDEGSTFYIILPDRQHSDAPFILPDNNGLADIS